MQQFVSIITDTYNDIINANHSMKEVGTIKDVLLFGEINDAINNNIINKDDFKNFSKIKSNILSQQEVIDKIDVSNMEIIKMLQYVNACAFMPYDVFSQIGHAYTNLKVFKPYTTNNFNHIYVLSNKDNNKMSVDIDKIELLSKIASITIKSLSKLFKKTINLKVNIILYAMSATKKFPEEKYDVISENNVNSGDSTIFSFYDETESNTIYNLVNNPLIRLYRSEELIKVLIHEIIHCTKFESHFGPSPKHNFKVFSTKFNEKLLFNETITETLAEFINCVLYSLINNQDLNSVLNKEIDFGFIQTAKILDHFGFKSINDFTNNNIHDNRKILQQTSTFEYHILKSILLYKFNDFINILIKRGNTTDLMSLIIGVIENDNTYKQKVDSYIKILDSLPFKKSLRMTTIDIDDKKIMEGGNNNYYKYKYIKYKTKYIMHRNNVIEKI